MSQTTSNCSCRRLEARAEHVLPQLNCLALGGFVVGRGDRVKCFLGRGEKRVTVLFLITLSYIVLEIDWVEDLDRIAPAGRQLGRRAEVGKGDLVIEATVDDEGEEALERLGIVVECHSAVGEMDP